jgi:hypothetical protein
VYVSTAAIFGTAVHLPKGNTVGSQLMAATIRRRFVHIEKVSAHDGIVHVAETARAGRPF